VKLKNNLIFLAGPMMGAGEEQQVHVREALIDADRIREAGYLPYVPHLNIFWDMVAPRARDWWMAMNKDWLLLAGALVRRPGPSVGADLELRWAKAIKLPVFDIEEFLSQRPEFEEGLRLEVWPGDVSRETEG
jgi:hypothetical protein